MGVHQNFRGEARILWKLHQSLFCKSNDLRLSHGISRKLHTVFAHEQKIHVAECDFLLHAVVLHRGTTLSEGHYSVFAFRFGKWWLCSDMKIMSVSESAVLKPSKESYLLFYKRVGL